MVRCSGAGINNRANRPGINHLTLTTAAMTVSFLRNDLWRPYNILSMPAAEELSGHTSKMAVWPNHLGKCHNAYGDDALA